MAPENPEVVAMIDKTRRAFQIQQAESELARQLKKQELRQSNSLSKATIANVSLDLMSSTSWNPTNIDLRDYPEISREQLQKQEAMEAHAMTTVFQPLKSRR
jgi:hypothetical protein